MNAMGHDLPNMLGVDQTDVQEKIRELLPHYMAMERTGMGGMQVMAGHMPGPENTLPMMTGNGPYGPIQMGGMFTILKVRDNLKTNSGSDWYQPPEGTVAEKVAGGTEPGAGDSMIYTCPMHPEVRQAQSGSCAICGMTMIAVARTERK